MDFKEYRPLAALTAIYPVINHKMIYPLLGLGGETGEFIEAAEELTKYVGVAPNYEAQARANLIKEAGDIAWYIAELTTILGITPEFACKKPVQNVEKSLLRLSKYVFRIQEYTKKLFRDSNGEIKKYSYTLSINNIMTLIAIEVGGILSLYGYDFPEVFEANIRKLSDREKRGVLQGSGDNR